MKSLRIAMFTTFYPPYSFGGDAIGIQRMARALVARGHQVTVVHDIDAFRTMGGAEPAEAPEDGIRRIGLESGWAMMANLLTQQTGRPVTHRGAIDDILAAEFDIVWHNNMSLMGGPGLVGRPVDALKVYEAHEHWLVCPMHVLWRYNRELCDSRDCLKCTLSFKRPPQLWRYTGALDRALDTVDMIIAKSAFSAAKHAEFGLRQPMTVLPYFLPDMDLAEAPEPAVEPRPYFLFVGRLEKIKGLQDVFPAFEGPGNSDLVILGDGDYRAELERLAAGNPRIRFLGRMPPEDLTAWYRGAQALIVPSVCFETFGIILIESFRLGTPVIARRLGPFPEIVETAGGGILFDTDADLRAAMETAVDPDWRAAHGVAARAAFESRWSEGPVMAAFGAALARAAHGAGRRDLARALEGGAFETGHVHA